MQGIKKVMRANDFGLIKNHAIIKKHYSIYTSSLCRFC